MLNSARFRLGSCSTARLLRLFSTPPKASTGVNPALHRSPGERDITSLDLLEERIRTREQSREFTIGGQTQKWAYRSEMVNALDLDMNHRRIWMAFGIIIVFGFGAFVYVKSCVVMSRREEMEQRERIRKELNLQGADRKKIGIVDN